MSYLCVITEDAGFETCKVSLVDVVAANGAIVGSVVVTSSSSNFVVGTATLNTGGNEVYNGITHAQDTLLTFTVTALSSTAGEVADITVDWTTTTAAGQDTFPVKRSSLSYPSNQPTATPGTTPAVVGAAIITQAVTSTADGLLLGAINSNTTLATVTSSSAAYQASLPVSVVGTVIRGTSDSTGFDMIIKSGSGDLIGGYYAIFTVPVSSSWTATCTLAGRWDIEVVGNYVEGANIQPIVQSFLYAELPVIIPSGYYYLSAPVEFPYLSGQSMKGQGRSDILIGLSSSAADGISTRLRYTGSTYPAITLRGSEIDIGNFTLLGETPNPDTPPTPAVGSVAVLMSSDKAGSSSSLGPGKVDAHGIGIYAFETGLKLGETAAEVNNDICLWERMIFRNCTAAVQIVGNFAMEHTFTKCQFRHELTYAFDILGGGHVTIRDSFVAKPMEFLHFDTGFDQVGVNNRVYAVEYLKVDSQATASGGPFNLIVVESGAGNRAEVTFVRPQVSALYVTDTWSEGNIDDSMTCTIIDPAYTATVVTPFTVSTL